MTSFELGFNDQAKLYRLSDKHAAYIMEQVTDHPDFLNIIKNSPKVKNAEDLEFFEDFFKQAAVDNDFQLISEKLKLIL